jgi:hypothetical protein
MVRPLGERRSWVGDRDPDPQFQQNGEWLRITGYPENISGYVGLQPRQLTASEEVRAVTHDLGLSPTQSRKSEVDSETNSRLPT